MWRKESFTKRSKERLKGGGVPLLANIALHGMEEAIGVKYDYRGQLIGKRAVVRYADDLCVLL